MEQLGKCTINIRKPTYIYSIYLHWGSLGGKCMYINVNIYIGKYCQNH